MDDIDICPPWYYGSNLTEAVRVMRFGHPDPLG